MQLDQNLMFCEQMSLIGAVGTYKCTKTVKLQAPQAIPPFTQTGGPHDMGLGTRVNIVAKVTDPVDSAGGTATVAARLVMADDADLATNRKILQSSEAIPEDALVAGYEFRLGGTLPPGTSKNCFGVEFVTAGEALIAGKVTATLPKDRDSAAFV